MITPTITAVTNPPYRNISVGIGFSGDTSGGASGPSSCSGAAIGVNSILIIFVSFR